MAQSPVDLPLDQIQLFCQRYQVRELALFGSVLCDNFRADSDLVFLIEFEPEAQVGFVPLSKVQRELSAIVQRAVDLVPKHGLKPRIRQSVLASAEVIYAA